MCACWGLQACVDVCSSDAIGRSRETIWGKQPESYALSEVGALQGLRGCLGCMRNGREEVL